MNQILILMLLTLSFSINAAIYNKDGNKIPDREVFSDEVNWYAPSVKSTFFSGVGQLNSGCTVSLVDVGGNDNSPAYVLTNGHCTHLLSPQNTTIINRKLNSFGQQNIVTFKVYNEIAQKDRIKVPVFNIAYATMKGYDLALLRLEMTVGEIKALGLKIYEIEDKPPKKGQKVTMTGVLNPVINMGRGIWYADFDIPQLRTTHCSLGKSVTIKEGDKVYIDGPWMSMGYYIWDQSIQHNCSSVIGFSGSPIFSSNGKIIAIVNTGVKDAFNGHDDCIASRPCEVTKDGTEKVYPEKNYGIKLVNFDWSTYITSEVTD